MDNKDENDQCGGQNGLSFNLGGVGLIVGANALLQYLQYFFM